MTVFATCGHEVFSVDDLIPVEYDSGEIDHTAKEFVPAVASAVYCPACADDGVRAGWLRVGQYGSGRVAVMRGIADCARAALAQIGR